MCPVAQILKAEGREEGRLEGKVELLLEMDFSFKEIVDCLEAFVKQ